MEKIYFIGINGIGMSGLAKIMKCKGYDVKGADICTNYVTEELLSMGITVYNEHNEENVKVVSLSSLPTGAKSFFITHSGSKSITVFSLKSSVAVIYPDFLFIM